MPKYEVETIEIEKRLYYYHVEAESPEEAEELVRSGEGEMFHSDFIDGEIEEVKVEQLEPDPIENVDIDFQFLRNEKKNRVI